MNFEDILAIVTVAFLSSFSHCYAMCGGFNLAFMRLCSSDKNPFFFSLSYHLMRVGAYVILGAICGAFGKILTFNSKFQNFSFFVLGIFMVILALALASRGKFLFFLEKNFLFDKFFKKIMKKFLASKGFKSILILGFCNGFVPCGLVYFFLASAMSQDNVLDGAFVMLIFGLSTLPALVFFTQLSSLLKERFSQIFSYISYILIAIYGLNLAFYGFKNF